MTIMGMDEFGENVTLKKKRPKWPFIVSGIVMLALLGWTGVTTFFKIKFGDFQPPFSAPNVIVSIATTKTIQDEIEAIGTAQSAQSATITANVSEVIESLPVPDGARVQKGDVIAVLNDSGERASVAEAREAYNRYKELAKLNIAPKARMEQEQARLAVAEANLNERVIKAPFSGTLGIFNVEVGDMASPGMVITTIDNSEMLEIEFTVPEQDIASIALNMPITATSEALKGQEFSGTITAIDSRVDETSRALRVKATLPNAEGKLKAGMLLKTKILKATRPAMVLPEGTILSKGDQKSVLAIGKNEKGEDIAVEKNVVLGTTQAGFVEIASGLNEGDKVIVEGQLKAQPDTQVKIVETKTIEDLAKDSLDFAVSRKQEALRAEEIKNAPSKPLSDSSAEKISPLVIKQEPEKAKYEEADQAP